MDECISQGFHDAYVFLWRIFVRAPMLGYLYTMGTTEDWVFRVFRASIITPTLLIAKDGEFRIRRKFYSECKDVDNLDCYKTISNEYSFLIELHKFPDKLEEEED